MGEWVGVAIALVSSCLGGTAAAITRYLAGNTDPITMAILRWGIGFCCVLPAALLLKARWPQRKDWPAVAALGFCFFGVFFVLYNIAMSYTTAARASLALATLPLHTMVVGALLGIEPLTKRKSIGVGIAVLGVFAALASGLSSAPPGAWRGELIMTAAVLVHGVLQRLVPPVHPAVECARLSHRRHGHGCGRADPGGRLTGSVAILSQFGTAQWIAGLYLGIAGGALAFILWVLALERASPTRVANTMTVNPLAAGLLATQLVGEPITPNLVLGLIAVFAGIWIATSTAKGVILSLIGRDIVCCRCLELVGSQAMTIEVRQIREEDIESFHAAVGVVARERKYLALLEAPPIERARGFRSAQHREGLPAARRHHRSGGHRLVQHPAGFTRGDGACRRSLYGIAAAVARTGAG